jgi:hypothetical protein
MTPIDSLTDAEKAKISGVDLETYKKAQKELIARGELGSAKRWF